MTSTETVIKFDELRNKDRILCTDMDSGRDLESSVAIMELADQIHAAEGKICKIAGLSKLHRVHQARSLIVITVLQNHLDALEADLQSRLEFGEGS